MRNATDASAEREELGALSIGEWCLVAIAGLAVTILALSRMPWMMTRSFMASTPASLVLGEVVWWFAVGTGAGMFVYGLIRCVALTSADTGGDHRTHMEADRDAADRPHVAAIIAAVVVGAHSDRILAFLTMQRHYEHQMMPFFTTPVWVCMSAALIAATALRNSGPRALLIGPALAAAVPFSFGPSATPTAIFAIPLMILLVHAIPAPRDRSADASGRMGSVLPVALALGVFVLYGQTAHSSAGPRMMGAGWESYYVPMLLLPMVFGYVIAVATHFAVIGVERLKENAS